MYVFEKACLAHTHNRLNRSQSTESAEVPFSQGLPKSRKSEVQTLKKDPLPLLMMPEADWAADLSCFMWSEGRVYSGNKW